MAEEKKRAMAELAGDHDHRVFGCGNPLHLSRGRAVHPRRPGTEQSLGQLGLLPGQEHQRAHL